MLLGKLCERKDKIALMYMRRPCTNAANIAERKTWTQSEFCTWQNSVRGARAPESVYIVYQPRRRPNILKSLIDFR